MVGKREIKPVDMKIILNEKDRRIAGKTVSSSGLYFLGPKYPAPTSKGIANKPVIK